MLEQRVPPALLHRTPAVAPVLLAMALANL